MDSIFSSKGTSKKSKKDKTEKKEKKDKLARETEDDSSVLGIRKRQEDDNSAEFTSDDEHPAKKAKTLTFGETSVARGESSQKYTEEEEEEEEDEEDTTPLPKVDNENSDNPLLDLYKAFMQGNKDLASIFDSKLSAERRIELLNSLPSRTRSLYAWAIPDDRALRILHHFSPIVEVGAGKGYWGYCLQKYANKLAKIAAQDSSKAERAKQLEQKVKGIYTGYDKVALKLRKKREGKASGTDADIINKDEGWMSIQAGGAEALKSHKNATLLLCYPDEFEDDDQSLVSYYTHVY